MEALTIATAAPYEVLFGRGLLAQAGELTSKVVRGRRAVIVSDDIVADLYMDAARAAYESAGFQVVSYVFPHGEHSKSLDVLGALLNFCVESGLTRADFMVALGGGVVGDLTGLAAALYMRGIDFVQIPTTLLAMVDSSVGGKTAVNLPSGKNLCGAFYQPKLVICDMNTLSTLPKEIYAEGMAEVIKYGAICSPEILNELSSGGDMDAVIRECVRIKGEIVEQDERDTGLRQLLNFGHTFGHAIEKLNDFSIYHGEGVATGMLIAAYTAEKRGLCAAGVYAELKSLLAVHNLPLTTCFGVREIAAAAMGDKKKQGSTITLVLPTERGKCGLHPMPAADLAEFIAPCEGVVTGV